VAPSLLSILPANAVVDEETPRVTTRMGGLLVRAILRLYLHIMNEEDSFILSSCVCLSSSLFTYYLLFVWSVCLCT
jgi:hypothetical protein